MSMTAHKQYKQVQVKTANNKKLLLMLYQGCIKFLRIAKKSIKEEDMENANEYLKKSQAIIDELRYTLDMDKGGEISNNLYKLYNFMYSELISANINKEIEPIENVESLMMDLLETWKEVINNPNQEKEQQKINMSG
ncbi:MAG: flagellar export chaperone FliS [Halanaerobiales bacterium]|nr:flagellar export chaperone FliS [Halanaerobiales bacterium]